MAVVFKVIIAVAVASFICTLIELWTGYGYHDE